MPAKAGLGSARRARPLPQVQAFVHIALQAPRPPLRQTGACHVNAASLDLGGEALAQQHPTAIDELTGTRQAGVHGQKPGIGYAVSVQKDQPLSAGRTHSQVARARGRKTGVRMPDMAHRTAKSGQPALQGGQVLGRRAVVGHQNLAGCIALRRQCPQHRQQRVDPAVSQHDDAGFHVCRNRWPVHGGWRPNHHSFA